MRCEDIKAIIVMEVEFELGGKVADGTGHESEEDGSGGTDETRTGGNGNQTGDGSGAETDSGPFTLKAVILHTMRRGMRISK